MTNAITQLKEQAEKNFAELELPSFNYGNGFALNLTMEWEKIFTGIERAEDAEIIADQRVRICKLSDLGENFISKHAQKLILASENKLLALHYAVASETTVIIIPKNTVLENPIIIESKASSISAESIMIVAEEGAQAMIVEKAEKTASSLNSYYHSRIIQIYLKPKAKMTYCTMHNEKTGTHAFTSKRAEVEQDAEMKWFDLVIGEGFTQVQLRSNLQGVGAAAEQYQVIIGTESQLSDIKSDTFHQHSNTKSLMLAKGILSDKARAMYRGTVRVEKNAKNCQGHQRSDLLLMGEEAHGNAIPILEVENDEVSCSHATSMGQIDEEQLYYLLSRGLDEKEAKKILVLGFIEPLLQKITHEKSREEILNIIQLKLEK